MKFEKHGESYGIESYGIIDNNEEIGGMDIEIQPKIENIYIENIVIDPKHRGKGYLRKVIEKLQNDFKDYTIACLPLPQHQAKFEHLGFKKDIKVREDQFYKLSPSI